MTMRCFAFAFERTDRVAGWGFGIRPATTAVVLSTDRGELTSSFGRWRLTTLASNVEAMQITGPYRRLATIGPPHLSLADRGLTMATNPTRGLCLRFRRPMPGIEPTGLLRHPGLTVTVADCAGLATAIADLGGGPLIAR
jgi:hypothetical protein